MEAQDRPRSHRVEVGLRHAATAAGVLAGLLGAVIFSGWMLGLPLAAELSGAISTKTNAALGLALAGAALVLLVRQPVAGARLGVGRLCAALVLLLGALTFSEHLARWNLGIDQVLAHEPPGAAGVVSPNRMGPPAALGFTLLGLALLLLSRATGGRSSISPRP